MIISNNLISLPGFSCYTAPTQFIRLCMTWFLPLTQGAKAVVFICETGWRGRLTVCRWT